MVSVIGITQFIFLSLGVMAINILIKIGNVKPEEHPSLSLFLYKFGPWLFIIPILWVSMAALFTVTGKKESLDFFRVLGILIAAAILGVFGYAIFFQEI